LNRPSADATAAAVKEANTLDSTSVAVAVAVASSRSASAPVTDATHVAVSEISTTPGKGTGARRARPRSGSNSCGGLYRLSGGITRGIGYPYDGVSVTVYVTFSTCPVVIACAVSRRAVQ
jgi:hypothetical protein